MKAKPYVGITGPVSINEVESIIRDFHEVGYTMGANHIPMLGFLVSYKSLNNQPIQNKRYPPLNSLKELLMNADDRVLRIIHYNTREPGLAEQIQTLFNKEDFYNDNLCRAIQFNIVWPDVKEVDKIKRSMPDLTMVLQLSQKATENKTDREIVNKTKEYGAAIDYVLIDPSGGQGKEFDLEKSVNLHDEISARCPLITVGFAGGFVGDNVYPKVKSIIKKIGRNDFCIDAEGGLRDKLSENYGDDLLNMDKVKKYLEASSSILE